MTSRNKIIILVVLLIALVVIVPRLSLGVDSKTLKEKTIPNAVKLVIGNPETKFKVGDVKEKSGVYEFKLTIGEGSSAQEYVSYITKDGKLLFTSGVDIEKLTKPQSTPTPAKKASCDELPKETSAKLTAFVVADCPFGLQMQRLVNKAITEAPQLANSIEIRYIGSVENGKITSMHGDAEAQENLRQICLREEQEAKYWPYVNCYMKKEGQSNSCLASTGVDQGSLSACMSDSTRGLKYAQVDFDLANKFEISGSPTLLLNEKQKVSEFDFGGRVVDSMKQLVCC
jgi:hypothetical protein